MITNKYQVTGANNPAVNRTVFSPGTSPATMLAKTLGEQVVPALQGAADESYNQNLNKAFGTNQSSGDIADIVSNAPQYQSGMSQEEYYKLGEDYVGRIGASARATAALAENKVVSPLYAEAYTRKNLSAVAANPLLAPFASRATQEAGVYGGGTQKQIESLIQSDPQTALVSELAKKEAEAKAKYHEEVVGIMEKTKLPQAVVEQNLSRQANYEQQLKDADMAMPENVRTGIELDTLRFQGQIAYAVNENGQLDTAKVPSLNAKLAEQRAAAIAQITGSGMSPAAKKEQVELVDITYNGFSKQIEAMQKTTYDKVFKDAFALEAEVDFINANPQLAAVKNWSPELFNTMVGLTQQQRALRMEVLFPGQTVLSAATNFHKWIGKPVDLGSGQTSQVPFRPSPDVATVLQTPEGADQAAVAAMDNEEDFNAGAYEQTRAYPTETLRSVASGKNLREAAKGDEGSQKVVTTVVNNVLREVRGSIGAYEVATGKTSEPVMARVTTDARGRRSVRIRYPDHLEGRSESFDEMLRIFRSAPWAWPEGANDYLEAFNMAVNGETGVTPNGTDQQPDVIRGYAYGVPVAESMDRGGDKQAPRVRGTSQKRSNKPGIRFTSELPQYTQSSQNTPDGAPVESQAIPLNTAPRMRQNRAVLDQRPNLVQAKAATSQEEFIGRVDEMSGEEIKQLAQDLAADLMSPASRRLASQQFSWLTDSLDIKDEAVAGEEAVGPATTSAGGGEKRSITEEQQKLIDSLEAGKKYGGSNAIKVVEAREGELTPEQKVIVEEEGYVHGEYDDPVKGAELPTVGVGQTGEWKDKTFKETFDHHLKIAKKLIPDYDKLNEAGKKAIMSIVYRGNIKAGQRVTKLINEGKFKEAAKEYLNHDEYRRSKASEKLPKAKRWTGVYKRMDREAKLLSEAEVVSDVQD